MVTVQVTENGEYSVIYRMQGVQVTEVLTRDHRVALDEIAQKMRMDMGLHKGKTILNNTGREI